MYSARIARLIAGKVGYTATCFLAAVLLVVAGYAHKAVADLNGIGDGITIGGSSSVGAMNILVMGLESRTDFEGQCLSSGLLTAMHAGNVASCKDQTVGSQDTDTLILVHIFAGGQKAVGFSIPRDDLVTYPKAYFDGITTGKIDQAYYFAYVTSLDSTFGSSMSANERYLKANQAGQAAEIATVQSVTGVHIDNYVVMNLAGFYTLAQDFGGIEVCVTPTKVNGTADANLYDTASGWNAVADGYKLKKGGSQYLHLAADQSLAFVRDRDSLPDTDLSRTHRQQAVIDYVIWELKHENAFTDLGHLTALLGDAKQWLITNHGFDLADFATNMSALSGKNLKFYTLPIAGFADINLNGSMQDVNDIDLSYIRQVVSKAFNPPPPVKSSGKSAVKKKASVKVPPASTVTVDVYNGGTTPGLAGGVSQALVSLGYKAGTVADASTQSETPAAGTEVFYGAGASLNAAKIAADFGGTAKALASLPAQHVEVLLGTGSTVVPAGLAPTSSGSSSSSSSSPSSSPASSSAANNGAAGGVVTVAANAKYGIPCVY
ncbi:MAG TPA: LCP family protein [Trebonia sp.]|jgi:LCP family protein required for cell wall assembly|nr:LCP family protein [Trebonia sp.]